MRIERAVYGGAGLARIDGKVAFVPFVLPGELVDAIPSNHRKGFTEAALSGIVEAAPERVAAPCPYYGRCGGCHYQHADYPAQVRMKVAILRESLERAGIRDLPPIASVSGPPHGYRNRVRLHVDRATSALCYKERNSRRNLAVATCPIATPLLQAALRATQAVAQAQCLGEGCAEVELFENHDGTELLATFRAAGAALAPAAAGALADALAASLPALKGVAVTAHAGEDSEGGGWEQPSTRWGQASLDYAAAGERYQVSSGSFFQANAHLIDTLASLATAEQDETGAPEGKQRTAWDLYAGVGLFSKLLANRFASVIAVEGSPTSSADLRVNLGGRSKIVTSSVAEFLRRPVKEQPDLVLLDPPRAGLGKEVTGLLSRIGPAQITYVSCDPATLSRDLAALIHSGYQLRRLDMIDMFPQTYHLETVAQLRLA